MSGQKRKFARRQRSAFAQAAEQLEARRHLAAFDFPGVAYPVGDAPVMVVAVDLNGDGVLDIVSANRASWDVSVLRGNGDGTFAAQVRYPVRSPGSIVAADIDGDGHVDIATGASDRGTLSILWNDGTGGFGSPRSWNVGFNPRLAVADVDGDGDLDLVTANPGDIVESVSVLKNNGNRSFGPDVRFFGAGFAANAIAVGDFDGDGYVDLATTQASGSVTLWRNDGSGAFAAGAVRYTVGAGSSSIVAADIDRDGDTDLVTANSSGSVSVLTNAGSGTFGVAVSYATGQATRSVAVGDFDGDGDLDLVRSADGNVMILENLGNGSFATGAPQFIGGFSNYVTVTDVDQDQDLDLIVSSDFTDSVRVIRNLANPDFVPPGALAVDFLTELSHQLRITFSEPVNPDSLKVSAAYLQRLGVIGDIAPASVEWTQGNTVLMLSFPPLDDGEYRFTLEAGSVADVAGNLLASTVTLDGEGVFVLAGDANRDRRVDFADLLVVAQNYGQTGRTFSQGNFDYSPDGLVGFNDLLLLAQRYGLDLLQAAKAEHAAESPLGHGQLDRASERPASALSRIESIETEDVVTRVQSTGSSASAQVESISARSNRIGEVGFQRQGGRSVSPALQRFS